MLNVKRIRIISGLLGALNVAAGTALAPSVAVAGEADDLQAMIGRARRNVTDLQRIDDQRVSAEETAVLSTWLDEAWRLRSDKRYDAVREVLDRCDSQADMIREQITAGQLNAQARLEETALETSKKHIQELQQALAEAKQKKAVLEAVGK